MPVLSFSRLSAPFLNALFVVVAVVVIFGWLGCVFDSSVYNQVEQVYCYYINKM